MIAQIIVDISNSNVDRVFDYATDGIEVSKGCRVLVPFNHREIEGYCVGVAESTLVPTDKLKSVIRLLDDRPIISDELMALMDYMTDEYHLKRVDVLRLFLPSAMRMGKVKELIKTYCSVNPEYKGKDTKDFIRKGAKAQTDIYNYLCETEEAPQSYLTAEFSAAALRNLISRNIVITRKSQVRRRPYDKIIELDKAVTLTDSQKSAVDAILSQDERPILLHGVTGSGKTEVYLSAIAAALEKGKSSIMLVPEISLTPQVMKVFRSRFGDNIALLHSGLTDGQRFDEWRRVLLGEARVVVGARSAIFAPVKDIGLIIIDEEHDSSYVSDSNPRYNTRDVALFRAKFYNARLVMGTATPSIDSYYRATCGEYRLITMPERINKKAMPSIEIVNMCEELYSGNSTAFSAKLLSELDDVIANDNQAIIFLNRRGYSSYLMCRDCGYVAKCEDCDVSLVYHKDDDVLKCHYCQRRYKTLTECPNCKSPHIKRGYIGTEQICEFLKKRYSKINVLRMDNDTTRTKDAHYNILTEFSQKRANILVGTQMVTKGHDFPNVTLVGIIDADMSLHFADYRSVERTFQLITQVAGRAGREDKEGKVILQTYTPNHYVYRYAVTNDYIGFYNKEINLLQATKFPPFSVLVRILATNENEDVLALVISDIMEQVRALSAKSAGAFIYLNAMKAPLKRVQNKFRYQILMRLNVDFAHDVTRKIYKICDDTDKRDCTLFVEKNPTDLS